MRMIATFLKLLAARIRGRALDLEVGRTRLWLFPDGKILPAIAGADGAEDEDTEPDAEPEAEVEPEAEPDEDDEEPAPTPAPEPDDEAWDPERARRTIKKQRAEEKKLKAERDKIKAERDEMLREKETEQERTVRELGEAKAEAERLRAQSHRAVIDIALRDAAAEEGVPAKKVKRLLKLADREAITVDEDGTVEGADIAIADVLQEFPEFLGELPSGDDDPEPAPAPKRTPGANPDRKRSKGGEMTEKQVARLAREDPEKFADLVAEGKVNGQALGGKTLGRLRSEGKTDAHSVANEDGIAA